ncbi:uncharacterized protein [Littorina saxatilis]|uniref:Uncharacterized protein n=1 Tax=Littorina saxatilis TaxID=31220 RepID=A0AAN9GAX8_9CAEN
MANYGTSTLEDVPCVQYIMDELLQKIEDQQENDGELVLYEESETSTQQPSDQFKEIKGVTGSLSGLGEGIEYLHDNTHAQQEEVLCLCQELPTSKQLDGLEIKGGQQDELKCPDGVPTLHGYTTEYVPPDTAALNSQEKTNTTASNVSATMGNGDVDRVLENMNKSPKDLMSENPADNDYLPSSCPISLQREEDLLSEKEKSFLVFLDDMRNLTTKDKETRKDQPRRNFPRQQLPPKKTEEKGISCGQTPHHDKPLMHVLLDSQDVQPYQQYSQGDGDGEIGLAYNGCPDASVVPSSTKSLGIVGTKTTIQAMESCFVEPMEDAEVKDDDFIVEKGVLRSPVSHLSSMEDSAGTGNEAENFVEAANTIVQKLLAAAIEVTVADNETHDEDDAEFPHIGMRPPSTELADHMQNEHERPQIDSTDFDLTETFDGETEHCKGLYTLNVENVRSDQKVKYEGAHLTHHSALPGMEFTTFGKIEPGEPPDTTTVNKIAGEQVVRIDETEDTGDSLAQTDTFQNVSRMTEESPFTSSYCDLNENQMTTFEVCETDLVPDYKDREHFNLDQAKTLDQTEQNASTVIIVETNHQPRYGSEMQSYLGKQESPGLCAQEVPTTESNPKAFVEQEPPGYIAQECQSDTDVVTMHESFTSHSKELAPNRLMSSEDCLVPDQLTNMQESQQEEFIAEDSFYEDAGGKIKELKYPSPSFKWKYRPSCDEEEEGLTTPSDVEPALGNIQPLMTGLCNRSRRVGLSRKQKVKRLHNM